MSLLAVLAVTATAHTSLSAAVAALPHAFSSLPLSGGLKWWWLEVSPARKCLASLSNQQHLNSFLRYIFSRKWKITANRAYLRKAVNFFQHLHLNIDGCDLESYHCIRGWNHIFKSVSSCSSGSLRLWSNAKSWKKSKPNQTLQPVRMEGPGRWCGINTQLSKAYVGSDFLWRWQVVLFWKELHMTHILKSSSTSVGKLECWSIKPEPTLKPECVWALVGGSVHGEVGPSLPELLPRCTGQAPLAPNALGHGAEEVGANPGESAPRAWRICFGLQLGGTR